MLQEYVNHEAGLSQEEGEKIYKCKVCKKESTPEKIAPLGHDPMDTATTAEGLSEILRKASLTWPKLSVKTNITNFSGVRAHLESDDFIVGPCKSCPGYFEAIGIESPGLSSAPAIAEALASAVAEKMSLRKKETVVPVPVLHTGFHPDDAGSRFLHRIRDPVPVFIRRSVFLRPHKRKKKKHQQKCCYHTRPPGFFVPVYSESVHLVLCQTQFVRQNGSASPGLHTPRGLLH